jgi:hypothetical protein
MLLFDVVSKSFRKATVHSIVVDLWPSIERRELLYNTGTGNTLVQFLHTVYYVVEP